MQESNRPASLVSHTVMGRSGTPVSYETGQPLPFPNPSAVSMPLASPASMSVAAPTQYNQYRQPVLYYGPRLVQGYQPGTQLSYGHQSEYITTIAAIMMSQAKFEVGVSCAKNIVIRKPNAGVKAASAPYQNAFTIPDLSLTDSVRRIAIGTQLEQHKPITAASPTESATLATTHLKPESEKQLFLSAVSAPAAIECKEEEGTKNKRKQGLRAEKTVRPEVLSSLSKEQAAVFTTEENDSNILHILKGIVLYFSGKYQGKYKEYSTVINLGNKIEITPGIRQNLVDFLQEHIASKDNPIKKLYNKLLHAEAEQITATNNILINHFMMFLHPKLAKLLAVKAFHDFVDSCEPEEDKTFYLKLEEKIVTKMSNFITKKGVTEMEKIKPACALACRTEKALSEKEGTPSPAATAGIPTLSDDSKERSHVDSNKVRTAMVRVVSERSPTISPQAPRITTSCGVIMGTGNASSGQLSENSCLATAGNTATNSNRKCKTTVSHATGADLERELNEPFKSSLAR
jgi:hypothetical protein